MHCSCRPQSSGQVERMNRTLKEAMTKLSLETGVTDWTVLLPFALFRARNTPGPLGVTPFEILFGAPPPLTADPWTETHAPQSLLARLKALETVQKDVWVPLADHTSSRLGTLSTFIVTGQPTWNPGGRDTHRHQGRRHRLLDPCLSCQTCTTA